MYVDKKLGWVMAVQTLSRLNRTCPWKEETFVLDFVNEAEDIQTAFQPYYQNTILTQTTDANKLYDLEQDIYDYYIFSKDDVNQFAKLYYKSASADKLNSFIDSVITSYLEKSEDEQFDFKNQISKFVKDYAFISQIVTFSDNDLEKLYVFLKFLQKKLPHKKVELPLEVLQNINMDAYKIKKNFRWNIELDDEDGELDPIVWDGIWKPKEDEKDRLSNIIQTVNDKFGTEFSTDDKEILNSQFHRLKENESIQWLIKNDSRENAKHMFDKIFEQELTNLVNNHFSLYKKINNDKEMEEYIKEKMFDVLYKDKGR